MSVRFPLVNSVDFVERDHERNLLLLEHVDRLDGLRLEAVHDVDDQDGDVAEGRSTVSKVREGFVAGRVDDQKAWKLDSLLFEL